MTEDGDTEARRSEENCLAQGRRGNQIAEETSSEGSGGHSMGREAEVEAGPDTQLAPAILDSGTF
jgi:hypothetical protein